MSETPVLISDMSLSHFNTEIRDKKFAKFSEALNEHYLGSLFTHTRLSQILSQKIIPPYKIDIMSKEWSRTLDSELGTKGGHSNRLLMDRLAAGATIRLRDIQQYDPAISTFCRRVGRTFLARTQINAYLTPAHSQGLRPHFDPHDLFILQCEGEKNWRLYLECTGGQNLPLSSEIWNPSYRPGSKFHDLILRAGDVLYIPRGVMHEASCGEQESLHLAISLTPLTAADILLGAIGRHAQTDPSMRTTLVTNGTVAKSSVFALEASVREHLRSIVDQLDIRHELEVYFDEVLGVADDVGPVDILSCTRQGSSVD